MLIQLVEIKQLILQQKKMQTFALLSSWNTNRTYFPDATNCNYKLYITHELHCYRHDG